MLISRSLRLSDSAFLAKLFSQLVGREVLEEELDLKGLISDNNVFCVTFWDDNLLVAFASLIIYRTPLEGRVGRIEKVIVDEKYRGRGLGRKLMDSLLAKAKKEKLSELVLISDSKRTKARSLYGSLGFKIRDTGYFVLDLNS